MHLTQTNHKKNEKYRNTLKDYIQILPTKHIKLWCTDNNGQVETRIESNEVIGKWTLGKETEEGNGKQLEETCIENDLVRGNAFFIPTNENCEKLATWYNYCGTKKRHIDYIMISKLNRNWIINIDNKEMNNARTPTQHKMIEIKIIIKLKTIKDINFENNKPYDIKEYRKHN